LTNAARREFIAGGIPEHRLHVKPNFVSDPGTQGPGNTGRRRGFAFVGRLSGEKGVAVLLEAWRQVATEETLTVIGDGPLMPLAREAAAGDRRIRVEGWLARAAVCDNMAGRRAVVIPSQCSEMFPLTVVEAYAKGIPVIASRTPTLEELVVDGTSGLLADRGSSTDLARVMKQMLTDEGMATRMGMAGRQIYEAKYTSEQNYAMTMGVYRSAIEERKRGSP
jgi:glycosyltransferase involved in cell wall biosynthesis